MKISEARACVSYVRDKLASHPDVNAVGVGEKYSAGESRKTYAARIMVESKGQPSGKLIPEVIVTPAGTIETDIVEAPAAAFTTINSVLDGADIVIDGSQQRSGTLAFVSRSKKGVFGVTNAHVVTAPNGNAAGQAVLVDIGGQRTRIGTVAGHSPYRDDAINLHDVALIRLDPGAEKFAAPYAIEPFKNQRIKKVGRLSASPQGASRRVYTYASKAQGTLRLVTLSQITELSEGIIVTDTPTGRSLQFGRVFQLTAKSGEVMPGHSGSALVRALTPKHLLLVGIVFAGSGKTAFALSWSDIDDALASFGA